MEAWEILQKAMPTFPQSDETGKSLKFRFQKGLTRREEVAFGRFTHAF
jgi:hypothetical protein